MYGQSSSHKIIAFDYDETISAAPNTFLEVMLTFEKMGWHCIVVTYRQHTCSPEDLDFLLEKGYKVFFTGQVAKDKFMKSLGIEVDIWVDDSPETVVRSYDPAKGIFYN